MTTNTTYRLLRKYEVAEVDGGITTDKIDLNFILFFTTLNPPISTAVIFVFPHHVHKRCFYMVFICWGEAIIAGVGKFSVHVALTSSTSTRAASGTSTTSAFSMPSTILAFTATSLSIIISSAPLLIYVVLKPLVSVVSLLTTLVSMQMFIALNA